MVHTDVLESILGIKHVVDGFVCLQWSQDGPQIVRLLIRSMQCWGLLLPEYAPVINKARPWTSNGPKKCDLSEPKYRDRTGGDVFPVHCSERFTLRLLQFVIQHYDV